MDGSEDATRESAWHLATKVPRFRGNPEAVGDAFSLRSCTGTLLPISPINTPAEQQRRAYSPGEDRN